MATKNLLYIGIKGTALALDRATGQEVWRAELKGSDFVNVVLDGDELYAATKGELFRLDPGSGAVVWRNAMPGLGWGLVTIGTSANQQAVSMGEKKRRDQQAAAAAAAAGAGAS